MKISPARCRTLIAAGLAALASGCTVYKDANAVNFLALTSDGGAGKSLGFTEAKDCATTVFGFGRSEQDLSINKALARAHSEQGLRYLTTASVDREALNILVYRRVCLVVTGNGFK